MLAGRIFIYESLLLVLPQVCPIRLVLLFPTIRGEFGENFGNLTKILLASHLENVSARLLLLKHDANLYPYIMHCGCVSP